MVGNISISGVSKHFINPTGERITALDNVSLEIHSGSFVSLIGPSGCGKSTLLRLISGLIQMDEGELTLDGVPVTAPGADRGFMFQEHTLFPWLSIYDNIAFGLRARGIYKQEKDRVDEFIEMVGLKGFEHSYPHQLSGGMCQRASLARALVGKPKVLLLDEPLGALDAFTRMNMQDEILRIWKETGMTAIMVTHDVDEAVYLSDKVVVMTPRPGRITGTLDIQLSRPRARSSEDFLQYAARSCAACTTAERSRNRTTTSDASLYRGIQNSPIYTERFRRNHSVIPQRRRPRRLGRGEKSQVHAPAFFGHRRCPIECRAESAGFPPLLIIAPPNTYLC